MYPLSSRRRCSNSVVPPWSGFYSSPFSQSCHGPLTVTRSRADRGGTASKSIRKSPKALTAQAHFWFLGASSAASPDPPDFYEPWALTDRSGGTFCAIDSGSLQHRDSAYNIYAINHRPRHFHTSFPFLLIPSPPHVRSAFFSWPPNELPARLCRRWQVVFVRKRLDLPPHQSSSPTFP